MSPRSRNRLVKASLSRRQFLGRAGMLAGAVTLGPSLLAGCGGDDDDGGAAKLSCADELEKRARAKVTKAGSKSGSITISTWTDYIDEDLELVDVSSDVIGADVDYLDDVTDNNEFFTTRLQPTLGRGESAERDGIVLTDWMAARVIGLGWVQELDRSVAKNLGNLREALANPAWDPGRKFSIPWQSGMTGLAYNRAITGRDITSLEDLFDPAFAKQVTFLTEMRDTVGLLMLLDGKDPSKATFDDAQGAFDRIREAKDSGQLGGFADQGYVSDLETGNLTIAMAWSGDVLQASLANPDIRFVIPDEGGMLWSDNFMIPTSSVNADLATKWVDFFYDPANAAWLTANVQYISPVNGVNDQLVSVCGASEDLAGNPLVVPDDEALARVKIFGELDEEESRRFDERFAELSGI